MTDQPTTESKGQDGPAVVADGLTKVYDGFVAVDHLDLTIERGEVFGIVGPNGAGKTTTILMLLGLTEPTDGSARVLGMDPARDSLRIKSRVGYLPDEVGFYDDLSARANLRYAAELNRVPKAEIDSRMDQLLESVGLSGTADKRVSEFSRGMRQRLGVAEALIKNPEVLILDEPTVNIDPEGVRELLDLVQRLRSESGITVVLASHLLHQVEQVCDRLGIFVSGRMAAVGTVAELAAGIEKGHTFEVEVAARAIDAVTLMELVPGVRSATLDGERIVVTADRDVRPEIVELLADNGLGLLGLSTSTVDLDSIYHTYFTGAVNHDNVNA